MWRGLRRVSLGIALVAALVGLCVPNRALAFGSCRSDPVLVVNGAEADVVSTLWTDPSVVRELDYTVTVPAGSWIGRTTLTVGLGFPEKVTYVFSGAQPWGTMRIAATVQTQRGTSPFQTSVQVTTPLSLVWGPSTAGGLSTSTVTVVVDHLVML